MATEREELISAAKEAARSLRITARVVEYVALIALVLLVVFLLTDAYGWQAFTGLTITILVSVLLAGRVARARAVSLEIAAAQLAVTEAAQESDRTTPDARA